MANVGYEELQSITPPARDTIQDRVYQELRVAIMSGRFRPGRALSLRGVASAMGVSPTPVREALRQLAAEQAVTTLPNRTYGIALVSRARFADLVEVRQLIEGHAAAQAATRVARAEIARLRRINDTMRAAIGRRDLPRYIDMNREFHFGIYRAAGSDVLIPIIETLWLQVGPYLGAVYGDVTAPDDAPDHHEEILAALEARDPDLAARALRGEIAEGATVISASDLFDD